MTEKKVKRLSPVGIAKFPYLAEPDTSMGKAKYKVVLELDMADADSKAFIADLGKKVKEQYADGKGHLPYKKAESAEGDKVWVNFGTTYPINVFDAKKSLLPADVVSTIGMGSTIRVSFTENFYSVPGKKGMNLYLQAVQVLELVERRDMTADDFEFEESEGFAADTAVDAVEDGDEEIPF